MTVIDLKKKKSHKFTCHSRLRFAFTFKEIPCKYSPDIEQMYFL